MLIRVDVFQRERELVLGIYWSSWDSKQLYSSHETSALFRNTDDLPITCRAKLIISSYFSVFVSLPLSFCLSLSVSVLRQSIGSYIKLWLRPPVKKALTKCSSSIANLHPSQINVLNCQRRHTYAYTSYQILKEKDDYTCTWVGGKEHVVCRQNCVCVCVMVIHVHVHKLACCVKWIKSCGGDFVPFCEQGLLPVHKHL